MQMMNNVDKFLERLKTFKPLIDDGKIPKKSFDATRSYLELPHFNRQATPKPYQLDACTIDMFAIKTYSKTIIAQRVSQQIASCSLYTGKGLV